MPLLCRAPAKVNLTLEVLRRREDGYHEIKSLVQAIGLYDTLTLERTPEGIAVEVRGAEISGENLVTRAAEALLEHSGVDEGCRIELDKSIPVSAGLGGGSADAAASLIGLNKLWKLGLDREDLLGLAAMLGSDVSVFLEGGLAKVTGRGEMVERIDSNLAGHVIICVPHERPEKKTAAAYGLLDETMFTDGESTERFLEDLYSGRQASPSNVFDRVRRRLYPAMSLDFDRLVEAGFDPILGGAGPSFLVIRPSAADAQLARPRIESLVSNSDVLMAPFVGHGVRCEPAS